MDKSNLSNTVANLPFSQACENNKDAILAVLQKELKDSTHVFEIGSGTGQHSVYFASQLPHLKWQTSDVVANHATINAWHDAYPAPNLYQPLAFDLAHNLLPVNTVVKMPYDAIFTANTLHIISWSLVEKLFELVSEVLPLHGKLIVYGPFNENSRYTSESNRQFDTMLRQGNSGSGIRNKEDVIDLATQHDLTLSATHRMPANNQLLVFRKTAPTP
ncbi:DUF938 domain-containing protein [Psychrobacter sp. 72-O-c]|uniref:DUF938 domain-containing protein n=1 Tax=Psychrobacter sp. 72-O-c TaxID=2774125 RepID=UPI001917D79E|nr:DUF938 domain-containing protein [Psychrobacter sp. 72-O-c]